MANKVLSRPNVSHSLPRNAFDRSFVMNYQFSAGELHVCLCKPCIAGTKGKINRQVFTRSNEVNTAAFASLDQHFQFYKVPISLLWSYWNDFKLQINDLNSSSLLSFATGNPVVNLPPSVPSFDLSSFYSNNSVLWQTGTFDGSNSAVSTDAHRGGLITKQFTLLEELGYCCRSTVTSSSPSAVVDSQLVSLLPLAAFQKVYSDHFRNSSYEGNNAYSYNLDWFGQTKVSIDVNNSDDVAIFRHLSTPRFVDYRKDYFKNIYPGLIYVLGNQPNGNTWVLPSSVVGASSVPSTNYWAVGKGHNSGGADLTQVPSNFSSQQVISVSMIRSAFALDKLLRSSAYAPRHVRDQFEARYGVKHVGNKSESEFLGSFKNDVVIGEVTSTANTSSSSGSGDSLGAIGGKGVGSGRFADDIEFYCEEDSFIIGVTYILPRTSYDSVGIDGYLTKLSPTDFFQPEFQDLGLEPLFMKELSWTPDTTTVYNTIVGYRPRNEIYKISVDRNLGAFKSGVLRVPSASYSSGVISGSMSSSVGWLSPFVVHSNQYPSAGVNYYYFKCLPSDLDSIFVLQYQGNDPTTYQFFSNLVIKFITNQDMSVHGQPRL